MALCVKKSICLFHLSFEFVTSTGTICKYCLLVVRIGIPTTTFGTSGTCWLLSSLLCWKKLCDFYMMFLRSNLLQTIAGWFAGLCFLKQLKHKVFFSPTLAFLLDLKTFICIIWKTCVDGNTKHIWYWSLWLLQYAFLHYSSFLMILLQSEVWFSECQNWVLESIFKIYKCWLHCSPQVKIELCPLAMKLWG